MANTSIGAFSQLSNTDIPVNNEKTEVAKMDSISEYIGFKKEAEFKLLQNDKLIMENRAKISKAKKRYWQTSEDKLAKLETRNKELKMKLLTYKDSGSVKWLAFKLEFNNELDKVNFELTNFTVKDYYAKKTITSKVD